MRDIKRFCFVYAASYFKSMLYFDWLTDSLLSICIDGLVLHSQEIDKFNVPKVLFYAQRTPMDLFPLKEDKSHEILRILSEYKINS